MGLLYVAEKYILLQISMQTINTSHDLLFILIYRPTQAFLETDQKYSF